jgi:archaemetzincin
VNSFYIAPIGAAPPGLLDCAAAEVERFALPVVRLPPLAIPASAWDARRAQYNSVALMELLAANLPRDAARLLGITEADLAIPMLSFLFGQAQLRGRIALVSLARLRPEFYGLPPDPVLVERRLRKELLHEVGHTFGLVHCADTTCVMSLSTHIGEVDRKRENYCAHCYALLVEHAETDHHP